MSVTKKEKYKQYLKLRAKEAKLAEQKLQQWTKANALAESLIEKDGIISGVQEEFDEVDQRRDELIDELHERRAEYFEETDKQKDTLFPINKRFLFDEKKLKRLEKLFSNGGNF